jgi:Na+-transporting methylmalonyl-CoA/oxaloacetate decarboxylase gamma subunit
MTLEYQALVYSAIGIGGVFIVLGILAAFMWIMGIVSKSNGKTDIKVYETENSFKEKFTEKEILAIISAIQICHTLYEEDVVSVKPSANWKRYARMEQVRM